VVEVEHLGQYQAPSVSKASWDWGSGAKPVSGPGFGRLTYVEEPDGPGPSRRLPRRRRRKKIKSAINARNTDTPPITPPTIGPTRSPPGAPAPAGKAGLVVELGEAEVCDASVVRDDAGVVVVNLVSDLVVLVPVTETETVGCVRLVASPVAVPKTDVPKSLVPQPH